MPKVIIAAAEGEHALYNNVLDTFGNDDNKHRGSVYLTAGDSMFYRVPTADVSSDMWFHVLMAKNAASNGTANIGKTFLNIYDDNDDFLFGLREVNNVSNASEFKFEVRYASFATAGDDTSGNFVYIYTERDWVEIDIRMRVVGTTMTVDLYLNQQLRDTIVSNSGAAWGLPQRTILTSLKTNNLYDGVSYQDIIISDGVPTVGMELVTMAPSASGVFTDFTNNYTNIDEPGYDQNDLIFSTAAGQRESWICTTPTFDTSDKIIYAFVANQVVQTDLAGVVSDFVPFMRIAATVYDGVAIGADSLSPNSLIYIWTANPNTLAPWEQEDFDGLEVGLLTI